MGPSDSHYPETLLEKASVAQKALGDMFCSDYNKEELLLIIPTHPLPKLPGHQHRGDRAIGCFQERGHDDDASVRRALGTQDFEFGAPEALAPEALDREPESLAYLNSERFRI